MRGILFLLAGLSLGSCELETIVQSYDNSGRIDLNDRYPALGPGNFSGIDYFDDHSVLIMHERLNADFTSTLFAISIDPENLTSSAESFPPIEQNIVLEESVRTSATVNFLGTTPGNRVVNSFLSVNDELDFTNRIVEFDELEGEQVIDRQISGLHFYATVSNPLGNYNLINFDRNGQLLWSTDLTLRPVNLYEGSDQEVFVLLRSEDDFQDLTRLDAFGEPLWQVRVSGEEGLIPDVDRATAIFGSDSNTTTVIGTDENGNLIMGLIDPRGDFIFSRGYDEFSIIQFRDFMVTFDGAYMMALVGQDPLSDPSFIVVKLDHKGAPVWQTNYTLLDAPGDVQLIELPNKQAVVLTNTGDLVVLTPQE